MTLDFRGVPSPVISGLKRRDDTQRHTGQRPHEGIGRGWSDVRSHQTLHRSLHRKCGPALTLTSDFWLPEYERMNFCGLKPPHLWGFVMRAAGHAYSW